LNEGIYEARRRRQSHRINNIPRKLRTRGNEAYHASIVFDGQKSYRGEISRVGWRTDIPIRRFKQHDIVLWGVLKSGDQGTRIYEYRCKKLKRQQVTVLKRQEIQSKARIYDSRHRVTFPGPKNAQNFTFQ